MGKPLGSEKTGGREKGTPNKRTLTLHKHFEEINFNIPNTIVELLPKLDPKDQAIVLLKLMEFIYPKRKPSTDMKVEPLFDIFD